MDKVDVAEWINEHSRRDLSNIISLITETEKGFIYNDSLHLDYIEDKEIPFKFYKINGDLEISHSNLKNFNNFPDIIDGYFCFHDNPIKDFESWKVKEVSDTIQINGNANKATNWDFLAHTKFKSLWIDDYSNFFKKNKIPKAYKKYIDKEEEMIHYENFQKMIKKGIIIDQKQEEVDNYLDSFDSLLEESNDIEFMK